jgi:prepilin-type N-terminal cleavage/methylation domain-containing protein
VNLGIESGHINKADSCRVRYSILSEIYSTSVSKIGNSKFLSLIQESSIVAIRPPKSTSQGFTLIEMIVTVMVAGILMTVAAPSLLSLNKPLRDGSLQFKSQLSLIRSKAISSNKAYRIRPKFSTLAEYSNGIARNFVVEYAGNCRVTAMGGTNGWQMASQFDLDLPQNVGIPKVAITLPSGSVTNSLDWTTSGQRICFDNRGILEDTTTKIVLKDFQGFNKAKLAEFELTKVGGVDINTYNESASSTFAKINPSGQGNPEF